LRGPHRNRAARPVLRLGMPRFLRHVFLLALAATLLAACASLIGPRDIELPLAKLQSGLDRRFPLSGRMLEVFDIELTHPQLALQAQADRVALTVDASVAPLLVRQSWRGSMTLSGRLVLDPARNAVMLAEPRVDSFTVDGVDPARQRQLALAVNVLMRKIVTDAPLYQIRPEELRYGGVQFVPTRVVTTPRGLLVSVAPAG